MNIKVDEKEAGRSWGQGLGFKIVLYDSWWAYNK